MIYLMLMFEFLIIGAFTFGGGYAMIPLIQQAVLKNNWLSEEQIIDFIAVSESTPGPLAVNMSTYVGMRTAGIGGAVVATLGVVLPSFIIISVISRFYKKFQDSRLVKGCMSGLRPAVVALMSVAVLSVAESVFNITNLASRENIINLIIATVAGFLCYKKKHPILIIGVSAVMGVLLYW